MDILVRTSEMSHYGTFIVPSKTEVIATIEDSDDLCFRDFFYGSTVFDLMMAGF